MNILIVSIVLFTLAVCISYVLMWGVLKSPLITFFRDKPGMRKVHQRSIPRAGGLVIVLSFILVLYVWHFFLPTDIFNSLPPPLFNSLIFMAMCIFMVGLPDDTVSFVILNKAKFFLELLIAFEIAVLIGVRFNDIHIFGVTVHTGWLSVPLTMLWLTGVTNALNIIDGIDGLAGSVVIAGAVTIVTLAMMAQVTSIMLLSVVIGGLSIGFLFHNVSPARVFLGDTGSLFFGMFLGLLAIHVLSLPQQYFPVFIAPLIVGLPILDVCVAMARRFVKSFAMGRGWIGSIRSVTVADSEHMHHRLLYKGLTHSEACIILTIFACAIGATAVIISYLPSRSTFLILLYVATITLWLLKTLNFFSPLSSWYGFQWVSSHTSHSLTKKISVFSRDLVLKKALEAGADNYFEIEFLTDSLTMRIDTDAVLIDVTSNPDLLSESLLPQGDKKVPLIIVTGCEEEHYGWREKIPYSQCFVVRKPLYIPLLLEELEHLLDHSDNWNQALRETTIIQKAALEVNV